jgi:Ca2+-transporting ATPase
MDGDPDNRRGRPLKKRRPDKPWAVPGQDVLDALEVSADRGLDAAEVKERRREYGPNRLQRTQRKSAWQILLEQFKSLIVALLAVAGALSFAFGELVEGIAIVVVIVVNALIGFVTELRAVRSMEALRELSRVEAKVRRDGQAGEISAEKIVPGDIVLVSGGDVVTADLRLIEASKLRANESALTGESVPVGKRVEPIEEDIPLAERSNMLYKGTAVTRGAGEGVVVATGMETELGRISSLVEEAEEEATPLEKRLERLGQRLIWATLAVAVLVIVSGIVVGKEAVLMIETGVALAVASIPEGLPIVATVALARGMWRLARRNALINELSAVETLGATSVILTDKTGTLTENQMTVTRIDLSHDRFKVGGEGLELEGEFFRDEEQVDPSDDEALNRLLEVGVLCNDASLDQAREDESAAAIGDPLEVALLVAGAKAGFERERLLQDKPEAREVAFDSRTKMMATFHEEDGRYRVAVKGALGAVIEASTRVLTPEGDRELDDAEREEWVARNERMAEEGLRVLVAATKVVDDVDVEPYEGLTFLGLIGLQDPPREEVRPAVQDAHGAGVRVVMVTGDQPATARSIARAVGLVESDEADIRVVHGRDLDAPQDLSGEERQRVLEAPIFARVAPEQKLDLIALHQEDGAIVAMTGDGVNDAPALKKADIGVAMGQRGTQVAKEAADMVLKDDAFSTIVVAIRQGRAIFGNIRKFVLYLLSCNVAEVMIVALASLVNAPLPIRPLQILFLNLVTDVFPALALGVGEGDAALMARPPRDSDEPVMDRAHWLAVIGYGSLITLAVLGTFALAFSWLDLSQDRAVTLSFLTLAFAQLWHVFDMRAREAGVVRNDVVGNGYVWGALALCVILLLGAVYIPVLADVLVVVAPDIRGWALVLGASLLPLFLGQLAKQTKILW